MKYNSWKLMDKIDVAVRATPNYGGFTGFIVEHGDAKALESAKEWAGGRSWENNKEYKIHTFDNNGFTANILASAGGSSQGGRLSFWMCEVEKDGVKFTIGVNDSVLADLIKHSDISNGVVKQKVMFARKAGQPGLIHESMSAYPEAVADMEHKAKMKSAKKTSKWEIGGIYASLTQADICLGEVWDTMEEYEDKSDSHYYYGRYARTKLRKRETPIKSMVWVSVSREEYPTDFTKLVGDKAESNWIYFRAGKPPARAKTGQLEVKESDLKLIDKLLAKREEYSNSYSDEKVKGRYVRKSS